MAESIIKNDNSIMSQTLSNTKFYTNWSIMKTGNEVMLIISGFKNLTNVQINDFGVVIPEAYRPKRTVIITLVSSSSTYEAYRLNILTDGKITVYPYNGVATQRNVEDTITYIIG